MKYSSFKALLVKRFHLPKERSVGRAVRSFSLAEKTLFYFFVGIFLFSGISLLWKVNDSFLITVPTEGGTLTEGVVGNPRFINPVLSISEADKSLSALIYSGLVKIDGNGKVTNDLADEIKISPDMLNYTVHIKDTAIFHDGEPVTADDVLFTIQKIQDPSIKSPLYGDWGGVTVERIDDKTVTFTLKKAYAPFVSNLSLGILPRHIWKNVRNDEFTFSQFNTLAVGSGLYKIDTVERNSGGIPDLYHLVPFKEHLEGEAYISHLIFRFYASEKDLIDAYNNGDIDSLSGISSDQAGTLNIRGSRIISLPLPRIFGVFFNQSQNKALLDINVRTALDLSAPKEDIVANVLKGFATIIDSPLAPSSKSKATPLEEYDIRFAQARSLLEKNGWVKNPQTGILEKKSKSGTVVLSFSISTGNAPELRAVAEKLRDSWARLGAEVEVHVYETGDLNQNIIRPRKFDALLFGEVVGRDADIYPFWHSSQRNDPGLNIALYANSKADKLLEDARKTSDIDLRTNNYNALEQEIKHDVPAVFLYSPNFIYVLPEGVGGIKLEELATPQDRFSSIKNWYIDTDSVWKLFVK